MNDFRVALGLLTIFPVRYDTLHISARALAWYPLVGSLLGITLAIAQFSLRLVLPDLMVAVFIVALWTILTGGLHLDGFADACDALFAATTRERRLEILRDVHLGTFGAAGLVLLLMLKATTLSSAPLAPIFLAPILGRWTIVFAATFPLARREGMAATFIAGLTRREIFMATTFTAIIAGLGGWLGFAAFSVGIATTWVIAQLALNRLGGLTGDIYGMICESVEVGVLLVGALKIF